jgi:uncharacterized protein with PIN domain
MAQAVSFYTDEHIAKAIARALRQRGVDVLTAAEAGMLGASDEDQLQFAFQQGRVLVTKDDDFLALHAGGHEHAGIAFAKPYYRIGDILPGLMLIYEVLHADDMRGKVEHL